MTSLPLSAAKNGDTEALWVLYDAMYDRTYRFIFHRVLDTILTEDIISEVSMKLVRNISRFRGNSDGEFFSWILQIAYTTTIDTLRKRIPLSSFEDVEWEIGYEHRDSIDINSKIKEILTYMQSFSEREKNIVTMRIWDDLSYEEIAVLTGESKSNAKKIVSRALAKIVANVSPLIFIIFLALDVLYR